MQLPLFPGGHGRFQFEAEHIVVQVLTDKTGTFQIEFIYHRAPAESQPYLCDVLAAFVFHQVGAPGFETTTLGIQIHVHTDVGEAGYGHVPQMLEVAFVISEELALIIGCYVVVEDMGVVVNPAEATEEYRTGYHGDSIAGGAGVAGNVA